MIGLSSSRSENATLIDWSVFEETFIKKFFPRELREDKMEELINIK